MSTETTTLQYQTRVEFDARNQIYTIINQDCPSFLRSYAFHDEYEANLAYALWLQFSKGKSDPNYNEFQWILKAAFRIIGTPSVWTE